MTHVLATLDNRSIKKVLIALSIYITSLMAANTLGLKVMPFLFDSHLSVGVFMFPVVFLMTDLIGEVYGKRVAKLFVQAGIVSTALFILYSLVSLAAPWSADGLWAKDGYEQMFGISTRIAIASLVAFAVGEYQDVLSFFFLKGRWGRKLLWLRSLLSNMWSQLLDTVLFMTIAFLGVYDTPTLISLMVTWWLFKVLVGFCYTPLLYVGLWVLKDKHSGA